jgi:hypothetical protein
MYLVTISASDFTLLQPQSIFTGIWAIVALGLGMFPAIAAYGLATNAAAVNDLRFTLIRRILWAVAGFVSGWVIVGLVSTWTLASIGVDDSSLGFPPTTLTSKSFLRAMPARIGEIALVYAGILGLGWIPSGLRAGTSRELTFVAVFATVIAMFPVSGLYGQIPKAFGGGKPEHVSLVLTKDGAGVWGRLVDSSVGERSIETGRVELLYETKDQLIIRRDNEVLRLDPKLVGFIRYHR